MEKYNGNFTSREDVAREFAQVKGSRYADNIEISDDFPTEEEIIYANYDTPPYEGYAFFLFEKNGKLYEINASHCSCNGLEDCWGPEETSWEALAIRKPDYYSGLPSEVVELARSKIAA